MTLQTHTCSSALVWGARGFIGGSLVQELLAHGWSVRVLTRRNDGPAPSWAGAVEWIDLAGDRAQAFARAVDGADVVFNLAGSSGAVASNDDPMESLDSNCRLQLEFLAACAGARRRPHVVFASSRLVYAQAGRAPVSEASPVGPVSMYATHKLCVEHYHRIFAQRRALTYTICRISNPYGIDAAAPGKGYGFINTLIQRGLSNGALTLFGDGLQLRDYIYIEDLVAMLRLCGERAEARNEVLNLGFGHSVTMRHAAEEIQRALGGTLEFREWPDSYQAVESGDFVMHTGRARVVLGFAPARTFAAGLEQVRALVSPPATVAGLPAAYVVPAAGIGAIT